MKYQEFKGILTAHVNGFIGELDGVYGDQTLSTEEKMSRFADISAKYDFPLNDVVV